MAINSHLLRRPSDRGLFLVAAIGFPLLVLIGYFKTYYFSPFFDARPIANALVHAHGLVMSLWVIYFVAQVWLIRSKNIKLHRRMGMAGVALALIVIIVGMATAYDANLVRRLSPDGINPHSFFIFPFGDMLMFAILFAGAVYYRKRPAEHKTLMLMTAINFLPAAFSRMPIFPPDSVFYWAFGIASGLAIICLIWHSAKHRKINKVFAVAGVLYTASNILRFVVLDSEIWLRFVAIIAP